MIQIAGNPVLHQTHDIYLPSERKCMLNTYFALNQSQEYQPFSGFSFNSQQNMETARRIRIYDKEPLNLKFEIKSKA